MQQEKLRILHVRRKLAREGASPLAIFQAIYQNVAAENKKQQPTNQRLVLQLMDYAERAERKRLDEKKKLYIALAKAYRDYALQNGRIVKAYGEFNSAEMTQAMDEVLTIEQQISKLGMKPVERTWFTISELEKVPLPDQKTAKNNGGATAGK
jgi:urease accessory protein UreE